jgi:pyruvate decarboxylase
LFITYGVGELSASNAVAGSYAEYTPVVHIVGTPARKHQNSGAIVHHGLGDGRMRVFADMARRITAGQVNLIDAESAPDLVDGVLQECVRQSRPVYVEFPSDMVDAQISGLALDQPLDLMPPRNVVEQEDATVDLLLERMSLAKQPMILVDGVTARLDIANELSEFIQMTGFPTMALPFGGGVVDRSLKNYHGVHAGKFGKLDFTSYTDSADLVLLFGPLLSDTNTLGWSTVPDPRVTIAFHKSKIETESTSHELHIKSFMQRLLVRLRQSQVSFDKRPCPSLGSPRALSEALPPTNPSAPIDQDTFWLRISSFFRPHDTILLANGTPVVGGRDFVLPAQTKLINSGLWLSIGHMLPAAQGVALAQQELQAAVRASGRTILFEGDGSFQTTAQELSTIIRYWLDVTIFIIKNDRYTFERLIHGLDAEYNDIAPWRYLEAASFFGAPTDDSYKVETHRVSTWGEIETVLRSEEFQDGKGLKMVEIMMGKEDVTREFKAALRLAGQQLGPVAD